MAHHFDSVLKTLVALSPEAWVRWLGLNVDGPVELVSTEIQRISARRADIVLLINGPRPWMLHIEFWSSPDKGGAASTLDYAVGIHGARGLPVLTVVFLLRPEADDGTVTGEYHFAMPDGHGVWFRYLVVRAYEHSCQEFLNGPAALLPLAVVANDALSDPEGIIDEVVRRAPDENEQPKFKILASILAALRHRNDVLEQLWRGIHHMEDSPLYQMILEEGKNRGIALGEKRGIELGEKRGIALGEKRGIKLGEKRGELQGKRDTLLRLGTRKWGAPTDDTRAAIAAIDSSERLNRLVDVIFDATSWSDLLSR